MAYNQKPGSAIKQKTGHGIPSALLQMGGGSEYEPDYSFYNQREKESGRGVTSQAKQLLKDLPQFKNLPEGVIDAQNSLNQVQMAQDSLAAVKGLKGQARIAAGEQWSNYSSINNPNSMASRRGNINNRTGKPYPRETYTGGGGNAITAEYDKADSPGNKKIKQKLLFELATSGYKTNAANIKDFNVEVDNPKSGAAKLAKMGFNPDGTQIKKVAPKKLAPRQMKPGSPMKQYIDPNEKEREQKRLNSMTAEQRARERKEGRPGDKKEVGRRTGIEREDSSKTPKNPKSREDKMPPGTKSEKIDTGLPKETFSKKDKKTDLEKEPKRIPRDSVRKEEGPKRINRENVRKAEGPMQLKSKAKMKKC